MIEQKLTVLLDSGVIDEDTYEYIKNVLTYLLANKLIADSQQADVFLTHLAMADGRRKKGESVNELEPFILEEIKNDTNYLHSIELWQDLQKMANKSFDDSELDYFYLHIINMLREE
ncbi:PRD domain-containing protein [Enterococcus sp. LJL99]